MQIFRSETSAGGATQVPTFVLCTRFVDQRVGDRGLCDRRLSLFWVLGGSVSWCLPGERWSGVAMVCDVVGVQQASVAFIGLAFPFVDLAFLFVG